MGGQGDRRRTRARGLPMGGRLHGLLGVARLASAAPAAQSRAHDGSRRRYLAAQSFGGSTPRHSTRHFRSNQIMTNKQYDAPKEMNCMMQCSDKMASRLPVDIIRTSHKLVLTKY